MLSFVLEVLESAGVGGERSPMALAQAFVSDWEPMVEVAQLRDVVVRAWHGSWPPPCLHGPHTLRCCGATVPVLYAPTSVLPVVASTFI